jgi:phospholipid transport system transporter-binding protein
MYEISAPITMGNATALLNEGLSAIAAGETEFSLAHTAGSDSSLLAVMLSWQRAAQVAGKGMKFDAVPDSVQAFAALYGLDDIIPGFSNANSVPRKPSH